jgi:hypothetical protein
MCPAIIGTIGVAVISGLFGVAGTSGGGAVVSATTRVNCPECDSTVALIATNPALIVRTSAVAGPVGVTVAISTLLVDHTTVVKGNGEPSVPLAVARTSSESPVRRSSADVVTSMVWIDASGVVDSPQAVSRAAASMIVGIFVIVEHSVRRLWR